MAEENKIKDTAEAVKAIVEAVPIYKDLVQPTAKEIGTATARTVRAALMPLKAVVWSFEQVGEWISDAVSKRLKDVPKERIVTPPLTVAGPAAEALRFAAGEPDLREMYANLLAKAMDSETAMTAHPAFVEILRQLTPDEAKLLQVLMEPGKLLPMVSVSRQFEGPGGSGGVTVLRHVSMLGLEAGCANPRLTTQYIENLCRLGICEIPPLMGYTDKNIYKELESRPEIQNMKATIEAQGHKAIIHHEMLQLTDFGRLFCSTCVTPK